MLEESKQDKKETPDTERLKAAFYLLGCNSDGLVDNNGLCKCFENMGFDQNIAQQNAKQVMNVLDKNKDGYIDFMDFVIGQMEVKLTTDDELICEQFNRIADPINCYECKYDKYIPTSPSASVMTTPRVSITSTRTLNEASLSISSVLSVFDNAVILEQDLICFFEDLICVNHMDDIMKEVDANEFGLITFDCFKTAMKKIDNICDIPIFNDAKRSRSTSVCLDQTEIDELLEDILLCDVDGV